MKWNMQVDVGYTIGLQLADVFLFRILLWQKIQEGQL